MKEIITLVLTVLIMIGCTNINIKEPKWREKTKSTMSPDGYILKEIDSCEYFMVHVSSYIDGGCYLPIHKNNCRFCEERKEKKLEELIIKLKK